MSIGADSRPENPPEPVAWTKRTNPRRWAVWATPSPVVRYVLVVDALALAAVIATTIHSAAGWTDAGHFGVLVGGSTVYVETTRSIERMRWVTSGADSPYTNLKTMWAFAGLMILPVPLAVALTVVVYAHAWFRATGRIPAYKVVFTISTVLLGSALANLILSANGSAFPNYPTGPDGLAMMLAAVLGFWFVNYVLVVGAILLADPGKLARRALGAVTDQLVALGSLGLGAAIAGLLTYDPWASGVLLLVVLALHRALLAGQFQSAANTDAKTGLASAHFWHETATKEPERAQRTGATLGVLMIDLDHFKAFNDLHGHLAGDQALRAVADAVKAETRAYDLAGRFGGEEFVLVLPGIDADEIGHSAERIRRRVETLIVTVDSTSGRATVDGITCSIGAAAYPDHGAAIDELLLAADTATYRAKGSGRNNVQLAVRTSDTPDGA
jgi:diguanylate cyclase (GGDEF)-like protein